MWFRPVSLKGCHLAIEEKDTEEEEEEEEEEDEEEEDEEEYEVETIVAKVLKRGVPHYVVKYKGYGPEGNTTEPLANLGNSMDKVNEFEQKQAEAEALRKAGLGLRQ